RKYRTSSSVGALSLAVWTAFLFYNVTESAVVKTHWMWVVFLLGALFVPKNQKSSLTRRPHKHKPGHSATMQPPEAGDPGTAEAVEKKRRASSPAASYSALKTPPSR